MRPAPGNWPSTAGPASLYWFPPALGVALLTATETALLKKFFGDLRPLQMAAAPLPYLWPLFAGLWLLLCRHHPTPPMEFWTTLAWLMPMDATGLLLVYTAVNLAPLSVTMPYLAFTPALVVGIGYAMLGETVRPWGVVGILGIVAGSYILNLRHFRRNDLLAPLRAIYQEEGPRLMLAAAVIYALTSVLGKKLVLLAGPLYSALAFWSISIPVVLTALTLSGRIRPRLLLLRPVRSCAVALVMAGHLLLHMYAISLTKVAYMIAVKRLSGFFSVLYGGLLFGERDLWPLAAGSLLMCLGVAVLAVAG